MQRSVRPESVGHRAKVAALHTLVCTVLLGSQLAVVRAEGPPLAGEVVFLHVTDAPVPTVGRLEAAIETCLGGASGLVVVDGDPYYRVFGFSFLSEEALESNRAAALVQASQRARLVASSQAAMYFLEAATWMTQEFARADSDMLDMEGLAVWSRGDASTAVREAVETGSAGFLPGGVVRTPQVVPLGPGLGACTVVAVDYALARR